ncbi:sensor histidine kinase [Arcobacter arenosus]|uniref:histidine kinase n=1 Tax=Arcobacter arenosus TaxID=2576037 RepID=A0A5R8Y189_9BACT|nr:HAMP domain-containing sensor histidine kinase [Arcobacter arenosus]TLP38450.1 HAMP domain-containing histidine kinase [Arcobacter arenosus]
MRQTKLDEFLELEEQNKELEKLINLEVEKNRQKDKIMFQQNKMAAMGEMLNNIAHQWRQPLMEISSLFIPIQAKIDFDLDIDKKELNQTIIKLNEITKYMSNTIDDFKNFFATTKEKEEFKLSSQINASLNILSSSLKNNNIMLDIIVKKNPTVYGYKNEYTQVLINIINNAKDILIQRKIKNPKIIITIDEAEDEVIICVEDNGGGVKVKPIEDIFKPFFTYEKMNGTGIGLFMSKLIIENNMNGRLWVENKKDGALFKIITNK